MKLSVIMPVFNEERTIAKAIKQVLSQSHVFELIVVDDGSTDDTKKILAKLTDPKITILHHHQNAGKGAAIQTALKKVSGDYLLINDADLEYDPKDIKKLIDPIHEKKATVVYGSRFKGPHTNMFFWHYVGNTFLNFLIDILYNTTLSDMESCYKLMPVTLIKSCNLRYKGFGFEPEVTCKILKSKHRIYEVPISYSGRGYGEGKKLRWIQGLTAVKIILKERFKNATT